MKVGSVRSVSAHEEFLPNGSCRHIFEGGEETFPRRLTDEFQARGKDPVSSFLDPRILDLVEGFNPRQIGGSWRVEVREISDGHARTSLANETNPHFHHKVAIAHTAGDSAASVRLWLERKDETFGHMMFARFNRGSRPGMVPGSLSQIHTSPVIPGA